jgi:hypothetical protein
MTRRTSTARTPRHLSYIPYRKNVPDRGTAPFPLEPDGPGQHTGTKACDWSLTCTRPAVRSKRQGGVAQQTATGPSCVRPANSTRFLDLRLKRVLGQLLNPCTVQRPAMRTCCRTVRRFRLVKVPTSSMYASLFGRCC